MTNSPFAADVHTSVNFSDLLHKGANLTRQIKSPIGRGRTWSKVEKDIVGTINDFKKEYIRQIDIHLKTYNRYLQLDTRTGSSDKKAKIQEFVAREEMHFWQDFPRNKKFYHSYLRKLYTLFNQCRMPDTLVNDKEESSDLRKPKESNPPLSRTSYIRDI